MDEFEFKPLTEGLGFQNQNAQKNTEPKPGFQARTSTIPAATSNAKIPSTPTSSTAKLNSLSTPLPRNSNPSLKTLDSSILETELPTTTVDDILKTLQNRKTPNITNTVQTRIDATPEKPQYRTAVFEFSAVMLDLMLVLAINLMCLMILLVTTQIDLFANLYTPDSDNMVYIGLGTLFVSISWMYLVTSRIFIGFTPGEWVFDQRLGLPEETGSAMYSLKATLRATVTVLTGFVVFPLISLFLGRDVLGQMMGLETMRKV